MATKYRLFLYSSDVDRLTHEDDYTTQEAAEAARDAWLGDRDLAESFGLGHWKIEERLNPHLRGQWHVNIIARPLDHKEEIEALVNKMSRLGNTEADIATFRKQITALQTQQAKQQKVILQGAFDVYETAMLEVDKAIDDFLRHENPRLWMRTERELRNAGICQRFLTDAKPFGWDIYKGEYAIRYKHHEETTAEELEAIRFKEAGFDSRSGNKRFEVKSAALRVTDPCYAIDTWCAGQVENVLNGTWSAHVGFYQEGQCSYSKERWATLLKEFREGNPEMEALLSGKREEKGEVVDEKVLKGIRAFINMRKFEDLDRYGDPSDWSGRVAYLHIRHTSVEPAEFNKENFQYVEGLDVGVDSGQAGFFDLDAFKLVASTEDTKRRDGSPHEVFYEACGEQTLEGEGWGPVQNMGVVSSSGYGDGGYNCYVRRNDEGQIVEARIVYISDDQDEEEGEE